MNKYLILIFYITSSSFSAYASENYSKDLDDIRKYCKLNFGKNISESISSLNRSGVLLNDIQYKTFELYVNLKYSKSIKKGKINFSCSLDDEKSHAAPVSPSILIKNEDAGGRYYRHIAWEKRVDSISAPALLSYVDYEFGDGKKTFITYFLYCFQVAPYSCVDLRFESKLTTLEKDLVIKSIKAIRLVLSS